MARIAITLDDATAEKFKALASVAGKTPSTLAGNLVRDYVDRHADEYIDELVQAAKVYNEQVGKVRARIRERTD